MSNSSLMPSPEGNDNVRVCVRVRPFNEREKSEQKILVANPAQRTVIFDSKPEPKTYNFDFVANEHTTQEEMWTQAGKPIVDTCMAGYNGTIFAYGQTGSGKTFTIQGGVKDNGQLIPELRGLVPRSFEYLFKAIQREEQTSGGRVAFTCKCSYLEIFQEQICDLLNPTAQVLNIREDSKQGMYVEGLSEEVVCNPDEAYRLLMLGARHRHTSPTAMNERSSRSHSVFTLSIESVETKGDVTSRRFSKLSLVDLAGSERQKSTEAAGQRLKEAGSINKSLFLLGNVIRDLVDVANGKPKHIPYRNSRLTFLLRDSLGGNSKTTIVATISGAADSFSETLSTLKFAARAKLIRNQAVINQDLSVSIPELQSELKRLKEELSVWQSRAGPPSRRAGAAGDTSDTGNKHADQRLRELETLLLTALDRAHSAEEEQSRILREYTELKSVNEKKETFVQNAKLLIKLRDSELAALKNKTGTLKGKEKDAKENSSEKERSLTAEVKALRAQLDAAPAQAEQALQFIEMRNRLRFLESQFAPEIALHAREVPKMQRYVSELTAALHECVSEKNVALSKATMSGAKSPLRAFAVNAGSPARRLVREQIEELQGDLVAAREELLQYKEIHSKLEAEAVESQSLALELEHALAAEKEARHTEIQTLKEIYEENVALLKDAYRTELLEPSARTEEAISSLLSERSQLQANSQQLRQKVKELEFTIKTKEHQAPASASLSCSALRRYSAETDDITSTHAVDHNEHTTALASSLMPLPSLAISDLEKKVQNRDAALEQATRELTSLRDDYETLQADFRFREEAAQRQTQTLNEAAEMLNQAEQRLASAEERSASLEEMMRRQMEALEVAKQSGQSSDQLMLESVEDNTRLRREVQQLQEETERKENALRDAKSARDRLETEATATAKEVQQLKAYVEERSEFCEKLRDAVRVHEEEAKVLRTQLAEAIFEAESATKSGQAISHDLERAREEVEEMRAFHESEASELQKQGSALRDELVLRNSEWTQVEVKLREDNTLLRDSLNRQADQLAIERSEASIAFSSYETERQARMNERARLISEFETMITKVEAEKIALMRESKSSTEKFSKEIKRLEDEAIRKLQERLAEQMAQTESTAEALTEMSARFASAERDTQQLQSQLATKEAEICDIDARLNVTLEALKTAEADIRAKSAAESALEERLAVLHTELASQVRAAEATATVLKDEAEKLREEVTRVTSERAADQEQLKRLKEAEVRAYEESMEWKNKTEQLQEEKLSLAKAKEALQLSFAEIETQNANLVSHSNSKQKIHLHVQIKEENNALRKDQATMVARIQKRDVHIKKLETELKKYIPHSALVSIAPAAPAPAATAVASTSATIQQIIDEDTENIAPIVLASTASTPASDQISIAAFAYLPPVATAAISSSASQTKARTAPSVVLMNSAMPPRTALAAPTDARKVGRK